MEFTKHNVRRFMLNDAPNHVDECGDVNTTKLAESAADAFGQAEQPGPLDNETHWIWDLAHEVSETGRHS